MWVKIAQREQQLKNPGSPRGGTEEGWYSGDRKIMEGSRVVGRKTS